MTPILERDLCRLLAKHISQQQFADAKVSLTCYNVPETECFSVLCQLIPGRKHCYILHNSFTVCEAATSYTLTSRGRHSSSAYSDGSETVQLAKVGSPALPDCAGPLGGVDAKHGEARRVKRHLRLHPKVQHVGDHLHAHASPITSMAFICMSRAHIH